MLEQKKTKRADLEKDRSIFFLMGLVVALSAIFVAFEWGTADFEVDEFEQTVVIEEVEDIEITEDDFEEPEPIIEEPDTPVNVETLQIVDDDVEVADVQIASVDDAADRIQQVFTPPAPTQRAREEVVEDQIFEYVEEMPEFPGGPQALLKWISDNVRYPAVAQENGIQGRVAVRFVIEKDGSVSNVEVVRGLDPSLDKAAVDVIKKMPKWKPGMQTGIPVRFRYIQQVTFRLE